MTTISEVLQSIKNLAETQERGSRLVGQKFKELAESQKKTKKTLDKFIGESSHQWGKFIETLTSTGAIKLLKERGIKVERTSTRVKDESPNRRYEVNILAANGREMVVIEVKKYLRKQDVDNAIKMFKIFKQYDSEANKKKLYGAVAYLECKEKINLYAEQQGLFVFQVTDNSAIIDNKQDFQPQSL